MIFVFSCSILSHSLAQPLLTVAQLAEDIDRTLRENGTSDTIARVSRDLEQLPERSVMIFGERQRQLQDEIDRCQQALRRTSKSGHSVEVKSRLNRARPIWAKIKSIYPPEALQLLPALWSCPMHQQLLVQAPGNCSTCGMALQPVYLTQPQLTADPIIRAEIISSAPLHVGRKANLRIRLLFNTDGRPVRLDDLEETHTRKIHLLINDVSESDYHHEHPEPVAQGEYAFSFTPTRPDTYRVWADLTPVATHIQLYSIADIASDTPGQGQPAGAEPQSRHAEIAGYAFDLQFDKPILRERDTVAGRLSVTNPDGTACRKLEMVMGAFGHFAGFSDDFSTVLHMHPVGPAILSSEERGGPELRFYFRAAKPGLVRLFAQVRIAGRDFFPRFVIDVQPLRRAGESATVAF